MPKVKIDYSSTLFYKIFCKDTLIEDLYIGHTTNFVQRKHAHKQSCSNTKTINYNCKLYNVIRDNGGWDNWKMQIIAFHECDDLMSAKKYEQQYFEEYNATLNSIEPLPKPKPKIIKDVIKKEQLFYCKLCNLHFGTTKLYEVHNKTKKHIKMVLNPEMAINNSPKIANKFHCEKCDYVCSRKYDYNKHNLTRKHQTAINGNETVVDKFECDTCSRYFKTNSGLWKHMKRCKVVKKSSCDIQSEHVDIVSNTNSNTDMEKITEMFKYMMTQNQDFIEKLLEVIPQICNNSSNINSGL
jgi:hypothetical protein